MASSIDKNGHNPLTQHESPQASTTRPAQPSAPANKAPAPKGPVESFSQDKLPQAAKAVMSQPMLGAFARGPSLTTGANKAGKPAAPNTLVEHQNVLDAASNVLAKTQAPGRLAKGAAGGAGMSALGVSLAVPFLALPAALGAVAVAGTAGLLARRSAQQRVKADATLQGDVNVLKAARDRYRGRSDLSQVEQDTLAVAEQGLKGVKS